MNVTTSDRGPCSTGGGASAAFNFEVLHACMESEVAAGFVDAVCGIGPIPKIGSGFIPDTDPEVIGIGVGLNLKTDSGEAKEDGIGLAPKTGSEVGDKDKGDRLIPKIGSGSDGEEVKRLSKSSPGVMESDSAGLKPIPIMGSAEICIEFLVVVGGTEVKGMMLERGRTL